MLCSPIRAICNWCFSSSFFVGGGGVNKQPRSQKIILHPTHSAWSERKGQWPRVLCATSPWELRFLVITGLLCTVSLKNSEPEKRVFYIPGWPSTLRSTESLKTVCGQWNVLDPYLRFSTTAIIGNKIASNLCCREVNVYIHSIKNQLGVEIDLFNSLWH